MVIGDSGGLFEAFIDSTPIFQLDGRDTLPDLGYTSFVLGIDAHNNQNAINTYSDDVWLGARQFGCE